MISAPFPKLLRLTQVYNRQKKARPMGQAFPPCRLTIFPLVRAKSNWQCWHSERGNSQAA
jgi:hypothetical protein